MKLYGYWRSGATYRLRNALNLKGLSYEIIPVDLRAGEQHAAAFRAKNPLGLVPALELAGGHVLTNSEAIIAFVDEVHQKPPLAPENPIERAHVRAFCATIGADVQPLGNLRVLKYLKAELGADDAAAAKWTANWITAAFAVLEPQAAQSAGRFCFGDTPGLAEIYLMPQIYTARRVGVDMTSYPKLSAVEQACAALEPFQKAHPDNQPDAPKS